MFSMMSTYLGDQWSIGDWAGMVAAAPTALPGWLANWMEGLAAQGDEPPQNLKEYDPEWSRAFWNGTATVNCDHARMLRQVKVPVLFTHHFRRIDPVGGGLMGAVSDQQAGEARRLIEAAGQPFTYHSFPEMGHAMHGENPGLYASTLQDWAKQL